MYLFCRLETWQKVWSREGSFNSPWMVAPPCQMVLIFQNHLLKFFMQNVHIRFIWFTLMVVSSISNIWQNALFDLIFQQYADAILWNVTCRFRTKHRYSNINYICTFKISTYSVISNFISDMLALKDWIANFTFIRSQGEQ